MPVLIFFILIIISVIIFYFHNDLDDNLFYFGIALFVFAIASATIISSMLPTLARKEQYIKGNTKILYIANSNWKSFSLKDRYIIYKYFEKYNKYLAELKRENNSLLYDFYIDDNIANLKLIKLKGKWDYIQE